MAIRLVTLMLLLTVGAVTAQNSRLPGKTKPKSYNLEITKFAPELEGTWSAKFEAEEDTNQIVLHVGRRIEIDSGSIKVTNNADGSLVVLKNPKFEHMKDLDQFKIFTDKDLIKKTEYGITMKYTSTGTIGSNLNEGFYNSVAPGTGKYIGLTQFLATGARHAFPCWDEPAIKATFQLKVKDATDYTVLSNDSPKEPAVLPEITFDPTPYEMSPHAMSWAIMKTADVKKTTSTKDTRVKIYTITDKETFCEITLTAAETAVPYLEDYLNTKKKVPREIKKLDLIITVNTKFPGVNNWGLQVYSEEAALFYDTDSTTYDKQRVWQIVTRESAHQWFGDLVTPVWWNEIWLSVGFATYFEYFALNEMQKEWQMNEQFVVQQTQVAFQADCYGDVPTTYVGKHKKTHPLIMLNVDTTSDIEKVFNNITYNKGASVVRMLNAIMEEAAFKTGVQNYLNKQKEKAVTSTILWGELESSVPSGRLPTGLKLADVMSKWTTQAGFPEIKATRDYNVGSVKFTQSQFVLPPSKTDDTLTWTVPIFWTSENDTSKTSLHWLQPDVSTSHQINFTSLPNQQWLLINKDQAGYFRVNYDTKNWQLLSKSYPNLSASNRAMLLDDALNLARGGRLNYTTALDVTALLPNEKNLAPWSAALNGFAFLYYRLSNEPESRATIEKYILEKMTFIYDFIGGFDIATTDKHVDLLMKQLILHWACRVGHVTCVKKADELFNKWILLATNVIKPDVRRVSYCMGIKQGRPADFNYLKSIYTTSNALDKPRIVYALGCSNDIVLLSEYLSDSLETSGTTGPTGRQVFTAVCQNPIGIQLALDFLTYQMSQAIIEWKEPEVSKAFSEDLAPKLNTKEQLDQLKKILAFNNNDQIKEGLQLAIGTLEGTLIWQEKYRVEVLDAMKGITEETNATSTTKTTTISSTSTTKTSTISTTTSPTTTPLKNSTITPTPSKPPSSASSITISVFLLLITLFISLYLRQI